MNDMHDDDFLLSPDSQSDYSYPPKPHSAHFPHKVLLRIIFSLAFLSIVLFGAGVLAGWQFGDHNVSTIASPTQASFVDERSLEEAREQVIAKVRPTVVQINVTGSKGGSLGSGVIIDKRGYIVTNNHVVTGGQQIQVVLYDGTTLPGRIVGTAPDDDLAVIEVSPTKVALNVATIGDSSQLEVGQDVMAVGNPLGITQTVTNGIVSALGRNVATGNNDQILPDTIQTDAAINPGNSGGALVDMQGNLVGIPTLTAIDPQFKTPANGVGFAIPSNRVNFIAPQLIASGHVTNTGRAALEVQIADVDALIAQQNKFPIQQGVFIVTLLHGGAADKAGLKINDIIVQVDDKVVTNILSLNDALIRKNPGDTAIVKVYRGHHELSFNVALGVLPAKN